MDITQIAAPAPRPITAASPIAARQSAVPEPVQTVGFLPVASTAVDLSTQGRFLSLASLFQKKTLELQASVEGDGDSSDVLANVAILAQTLADVFNELQTAPVDSTGALTDGVGRESLASQFFQRLDPSENAARATLGQIGLQFATGPTPATPGSVRVDEAALQNAFGADPASTSALLSRTADAFFGIVSSQMQSQAALLASPLAEPAPAFTLATPVPGVSAPLPPAPATASENATVVQESAAGQAQLVASADATRADPVAREARVPNERSRIDPALQDRLLSAAVPRPIAIAARDAAKRIDIPADLPPPVILPSPASQAMLAARDPAIAAAIAAYNLSTGPFAAQNLRPDIQPARPKAIAPVAAVTKVNALEPLGTPRERVS